MNNFLFGAQPIGSTSIGSVTVEHDGLEEAMYESWCEYEDLRGKSEIALCNVYENYIMNTSQSTEQKTALFEGVLGDIWKNVKEFFKKIAAKIKSWFNSLVKWFQSHFQSDEEFLKKYKDELTTKDTSKFAYSGYYWPAFKGGPSGASLEPLVNKVITAGKNSFQSIMKLGPDADVDAKVKEAKKEIDSKAIREAKGLKQGEDGGKGGLGKYKEAVKKNLRGKKFENKKGLPGLSVDEMISVIENGEEYIGEIKDMADKISDAADDYADKFDTYVKDAGGGENASSEEKSKARTKVTKATEVAKYSLSYGTALADVSASLMKECMAECRSVLGAILRYNDKEDTKESFSGYNQSNTVGLMEKFASF